MFEMGKFDRLDFIEFKKNEVIVKNTRYQDFQEKIENVDFVAMASNWFTRRIQ